MASFEDLADGHHVDDPGNLIACTYVDFRDPADRFPVTVLQRASSKRHAIPGCETIRISKPGCFLDQGERFTGDGESHYDTTGWIYCASTAPEAAEEQAAWRAAMPAGCDIVSPVRRPRQFARALGAMVAEQAGPRGRIVLLRNAVEGRMFSTAHKSQTVYHGPVAYLDNPYQRLESASSDLELALLLVFMKHATHRAQREYRFLAWAEDEPAEGVVDLKASPALIDAMLKPRPEPEDSGFLRPGAAEYSAIEDAAGAGQSGRGRVSKRCRLPSGPATRPWRRGPRTSRRCRATRARRRRCGRPSRRCAKRSTGWTWDAGSTRAAAAWHAEPVLRFICATLGCGVAGVQIADDGFIVVAAEVAGDGLVDVSITVGPEGTCASRVSAGGAHAASVAADPQSFETVLTGALGRGRGACVRRRQRALNLRPAGALQRVPPVIQCHRAATGLPASQDPRGSTAASTPMTGVGVRGRDRNS